MFGCNLACAYCWVVDKKKFGCADCNPQLYRFQSPEETFDVMKKLAVARGIDKVRVSGCEPLINKRHVLKVIKIAMSERFCYVLDSNLLLLDEDFLKQIKPYADRIYIYAGLKGANPGLFQQITKGEAQYWWKQLEGLRLIVKHGFTLGVNVMANLTPAKALPTLLHELYKLSPILPLTVDMKLCTFFPHNTKRIKRYGISLISPRTVKQTWDTLLEQKYGAATNLLEIFRRGETNKAFDRYELKMLREHVIWNNGLKFVKLPDVPFRIPYCENIAQPIGEQNGKMV